MAKLVSTGITDRRGTLQLDELLGGGIPQGFSILLTGPTGSAKTILAAQILAHNASKGKKCLYVTFDMSKDKIINQMKQFKLNFKSNPKLKVLELDPEKDKDVLYLFKLIDTSDYDMVAVDSLASLASVRFKHEKGRSVPEELTRNKVGHIIKSFQKNNITAILLNEQPEGSNALSRDGVSEFMCDGIFLLYYACVVSYVGRRDYRSIRVRKMRQVNHEKFPVPFEITHEGIKLIESTMVRRKCAQYSSRV